MNDPTPSVSQRRALDLPAVAMPTFSITHDVEGQCLVVRLSGNADSEVAQALANYLERLHEEVSSAKLKEVVLDFRELYFLTSSCIKCLVVAIKRLSAMDARAQYKIRLLTTPALRWQERSFEVLCQLAPMLVTITRD